MLSLHISPINNTTLKCVFRVGMSVFVSVCVNPSTASIPNSNSTPRVASWRKVQYIAAVEASKQTLSEIADSTQPKKCWHQSKQLYDQNNITTQIYIYSTTYSVRPVLNLATHMSVESWGGGGGRNKALQYFEFRLPSILHTTPYL